jgi:hypothetical protein
MSSSPSGGGGREGLRDTCGDLSVERSTSRPGRAPNRPGTLPAPHAGDPTIALGPEVSSLLCRERRGPLPGGVSDAAGEGRDRDPTP